MICVYHDKCFDGIAALWVVKRRFGVAKPYSGRYDEAPDLERLRGQHVILVDFSWKRSALERVCDVAKTLTVIDHHKSAQSDLEGFTCIAKHFDTNKSGAGLTWDVLFPGLERPFLVDAVEDRDLWRFRLPDTRAVHFAMGDVPASAEEFDAWVEVFADPARRTIALARGHAVAEHHDRLARACARYRPHAWLGGHHVPCVPCQTPALISDVGHLLSADAPFAATHLVRDDGSVQVSLRSAQTGLDVSEIAKGYGGGGHAHAAGFTALSVSALLGGAPCSS